MGIEVVHDPIDDTLRIGIDHIHQIAHHESKVLFGASLCDQDLSKARLGFDQDKEIASAVAFVFIILAYSVPRLERQWSCKVCQQLQAFFIKTDQWTLGIVGFVVQFQNMLHLLNEFWRDFRNTPTSYLPGFELVFFSNSRTVSGERCVTMPSFNTSRVNNSKVQRACPAGGSLQAKAIMRASCCSSNSEPVAGCGLSSKAACKPSCSNRSRVRRMVCSLTYNIWLISESGFPSSTFSK